MQPNIPAVRQRKSLRMGNRTVFNAVAYPPNGFDVLGRFKAVSHFLPQMPDVDGDGVVAFGVIFVFPKLMEKFLCADYLSPVLAEDR